MQRARKVVHPVMTLIGRAICAASALISLAVLLAFFSRRSDTLDPSLSPRRMAMLGVALLLVAVFVLAREARRDRRVKGALATLSLLCAAGGAVLVWTGFDHARPIRDPGPSIAENSHARGTGRKVQHGKGKLTPEKPHGGRPNPHKGAVTTDPEPSTGEVEAEKSTSPPPTCSCPAPERYVPPPPPETGGSPGRGTGTEWGSSASEEEWGEEEEEWEEESWSEEEESWEEWP